MIDKNKELFGRRIKQLQVIIEDESFIPNGSTNSYHEFILSMYRALITGRKITPKMESSITKIVKSYAKTLNPEDRKSTRLNSSHVVISYAVFCLKKKKINK